MIHGSQQSNHYIVSGDVKITTDNGKNQMQHEGSSIKAWRFCNNIGCGNNQRIGTHEYHLRQNTFGVCRLVWDNWGVSALSFQCADQAKFEFPTDGQFHHWIWESDASNYPTIRFTFWLDGALRYSRVSDASNNISGDVWGSLLLDMYSCGTVGPDCNTRTDTGQFIIDNATIEYVP